MNCYYTQVILRGTAALCVEGFEDVLFSLVERK